MIKVSGVFLCDPEDGYCGFGDIRVLEILDNEGIGDIEWGEIEECLNNSFDDYKEYKDVAMYEFELKKVWDIEDETTDSVLHFEILSKKEIPFILMGKNEDSFHCDDCLNCFFECKKDKEKEVSDAH